MQPDHDTSSVESIDTRLDTLPCRINRDTSCIFTPILRLWLRKLTGNRDRNFAKHAHGLTSN